MRTGTVDVYKRQVIGVCVVSHEFGHFLSAKLLGVQVLEFAFGMGPAIFKKRGKETLWSIRIFPIGGFVRLAGMGEALDDETEDPQRSFNAQSAWRRWFIPVSYTHLQRVSV